MVTVTKNDLTKEIVERTGCKRELAKQAVDSIFDALRESLMAGNRIEMRGFGAWSVRWKKPNPNARNPKTGESIFVPARRKVHFKPGKVLKAALKESAGGGRSGLRLFPPACVPGRQARRLNRAGDFRRRPSLALVTWWHGWCIAGDPPREGRLSVMMSLREVYLRLGNVLEEWRAKK